MKTDELLNAAIDAAIDAGNRIMEIYGTEDFGVDFKSDDSPLTKADIASHEIIVQHLKGFEIPILSEEGKHLPFDTRETWDALWIVDPIDGTKEFIKRNGEFTVNIALIKNQRPIAGVVLVPAMKELYFSSENIGSYKTTDLEQKKSIEQRIGLAQKLPLNSNDRPYTVVASRSHLSKETEAFINELEEKHGKVAILSRGSSLKLCMVAEGSADCYPRFAPTMEWDTAAGQAICMFADCTVINWQTKSSLLYNRQELLNPWFLVERAN